MIKNIAKKSLVLVLLAGIGFSAVAQERVYAIDQRGAVVKSGFGLCWRDGYWTPAAAAKDAAGCECDKDLLPAEACGAKPAAAVTPATPAAKTGIVGEKITVAADALFDFNKAVLRPEGKAKLDDVVAKSKAIKLEVILA
ncbi:MAG: OmpA family protein, partial [Azonexus sp.]